MKRLYSNALVVSVAALIFVSGADAQNYKITQTVSMNGQKMTSTTYVRGQRKRTEGGAIMGIGADVATIEQCDLKQTVKVNDKKKMYSVDPFDNGDQTPVPAAKTVGARPKSAPATRGGTVTYVSNVTDTGERKQMFGMTARRVKSSMSIEASPDACMKTDMSTETDGWYIDLPQFSCPISIRPPQMPAGPLALSGGCQDHISFRTTGGGKMGFPLTETRTITQGGMTFTQTVETLDFSRATLDISMFDIPQGYALASNSQELYGQPDMAAMIRAAQNGDDASSPSPVRSPSITPGFAGIKIAVLMPTNRGDSVSTSGLQNYLVERLSGGNVRAVAVGSEAEARAAGVDYILTSDITKLKQSTAGKIGGVFGKVTGTPTAGPFDAQVDYKLVKLADGKTVLQNRASAKTETEVTRAAEGVLAMEATAVLGVAK